MPSHGRPARPATRQRVDDTPRPAARTAREGRAFHSGSPVPSCTPCHSRRVPAANRELARMSKPVVDVAHEIRAARATRSIHDGRALGMHLFDVAAELAELVDAAQKLVAGQTNGYDAVAGLDLPHSMDGDEQHGR